MQNINELVRMNQSDIVATIPSLSDVERAELAKAELARDKPRSGVLSALNVDMNTVSKESSAKVVETLDMGRPFSMVWVGDTKHYFQNGKVYDFATKEVLATSDDAKNEKIAAKK